MSLHRVALDFTGATFIENYRIEVYRGVLRYARENTRWQILFNIHSFSLTHKFSRYEDLAALKADGLIFLNSDEDSLEKVKALRIPAICITDLGEAPTLPTAISDDAAVGRFAAEYFLNKGYRKFGYSGSMQNHWSRKRLGGYQDTLRASDCDCSIFTYEQELDEDPERDEAIAERMRRWLENLDKPLALFAENDTRALHLLEACRALGLQAPRDVAILGCDNNEMICESTVPSLSSIELNTERVGYEAAALLERMLDGEPWDGSHIVLPPKGVATRMSSDILAVDDPRIRSALDFIQNHLADRIGVEDIVRAAGVSRSSLEKCFRSQLGTTVLNELRRQRLHRAKQLLSDTILSIDRVAELCGYSRSTYFVNVFRKAFEVTPGEWRRQSHP